ncbi:unnamed protein product, partial [Heterotrigona itama]
IINLLLLNNFYPVTLYRRTKKESDELLYIRFGHSLRSANQLPVQEIINLLLLNNFYPVTLYRRTKKESDELLYIRFGHSLRSAN